MKKYIYLIFTGIVGFFIGCQSPDDLVPSTNSMGFNSITAYFIDGEYTNAEFRTTVTDINADIVINIPYYFPEETNNKTTLGKMRVIASIDDNCTISPKLGVLDLTKKNYFTFTNGLGETKKICITGAVKMLSGSQITYFAIPADDATSFAGVTGTIDQEDKVISLITVDDLSSVNAEFKLSPHATISPDPSTTKVNLNQDTQFTVTAQDGTTTTYTVTKAAPEKIGYGYRSGSEKLLWSFDFTTSGFAWGGSNHASLAAIGNNLIVNMGNGTTPKYFNRITGVKIGDINLGSASAEGCITNDLNGNLLICNYADNGNTFRIYKTKSVTTAPTAFITYANSTGYTLGRKVSVQGSIDGDAIVSAELESWDGSSSFVRWIVTGGVVGTPEIIAMSGVSNWSAGVTVADVVYASENPADGYFTSFYSADVLHYMKGTSSMASLDPQSDGSGWAYNNNCLDVKAFNGARYLLLGCVSHFPQWSINTQLYLYDVTSLGQFTGTVDTSPALTFRPSVTSFNGLEGVSASGDVLLVPSSDGYTLSLYYIDNNCKALGAYQFDCIKK
ncbi:MAG: hypothetical protein H6Q20_1568 [Bacteroidetes bacterium]|nr:hypothetical protein [Bacteroidota bacterium]